MTTSRQLQDANRGQGTGNAGRNSMILALFLAIGVMVVEVIGGWMSESLALLADAGHCLRYSRGGVHGVGREPPRLR